MGRVVSECLLRKGGGRGQWGEREGRGAFTWFLDGVGGAIAFGGGLGEW